MFKCHYLVFVGVYMQSCQASKGFTLIELMVVVAIIGILGALAASQYTQYTRNAKFSEVMQALGPYKVAVNLCIQDLAVPVGDVTIPGACDTGGQGIPAAISSSNSSTYLASVGVVDGVITATARNTKGLNSETAILTPSPLDSANWQSGVKWVVSGTCKTIMPVMC
jgi:type IV pilus assembly protein PilA